MQLFFDFVMDLSAIAFNLWLAIIAICFCSFLLARLVGGFERMGGIELLVSMIIIFGLAVSVGKSDNSFLIGLVCAIFGVLGFIVGGAFGPLRPQSYSRTATTETTRRVDIQV